MFYKERQDVFLLGNIFDHRLSTAKVASFPFSSVVKFCVAFLFMIDGYLATNMNITCTYDVIGARSLINFRQ